MMSNKSTPSNPLLPVHTFDQNKVFIELALKVASNPALVKLLEHSFTSEERGQLANALYTLLPSRWHRVVKDPWVAFTSYCKWVLLNFIANSIAEVCL